jgi:hypothetical protein
MTSQTGVLEIADYACYKVWGYPRNIVLTLTLFGISLLFDDTTPPAKTFVSNLLPLGNPVSS